MVIAPGEPRIPRACYSMEPDDNFIDIKLYSGLISDQDSKSTIFLPVPRAKRAAAASRGAQCKEATAI